MKNDIVWELLSLIQSFEIIIIIIFKIEFFESSEFFCFNYQDAFYSLLVRSRCYSFLASHGKVKGLIITICWLFVFHYLLFDLRLFVNCFLRLI